MYIGCCFDHNRTNYGPFTKTKLMKYGKIIHRLYWILAKATKNLLHIEFHLRALNQDSTAVQSSPHVSTIWCI
jgi:hypothetical protein